MSVAFEYNCVHTHKQRHCQRRECSAGALLSGDIRFMRIFAGVLWIRGVKRQWDRALTRATHWRTLFFIRFV